MLFIVPDGEGPSEPEAPGASASQPASARKLPTVKVELDLDDAPFLEEAAPEPPKPEPAKTESASQPARAGTAEKTSPADKIRARLAALLAVLKAKKKLVIIAGGGLALLVVLAVVLKFFLFGKPPAPPPPEQPRHISEPAPAAKPEAPPEPEYTYTFEPFLVEIRGTEGEIHFLQCSFSVITKNPVLKTELEVKAVVLRDSLYYYLSNRTLAFLTDPKMADQRKADMINVINEHVSAEKINNLHFQDFLVSRPKQ